MIDLSKVKTSDYIQWLKNPGDIYYLFKIIDSAVQGGIYDKPMTELPSIMAQFMAAQAEFKVEFDLAIGSMNNHLASNEGD